MIDPAVTSGARWLVPAFPLAPRRRTERALLTAVEEAHIAGVSMRRVDDLVQAFGIEGISKSEVSRTCARARR
jgi:putative transposase